MDFEGYEFVHSIQLKPINFTNVFSIIFGEIVTTIRSESVRKCMLDGFTPVKEILKSEPNTFVDTLVLCSNIATNPSETEMQQEGLLVDGEGTKIGFLSWESSDAPRLDPGTAYEITDALVISNAERGRALLLKSQTEAEETEAPEILSDSVTCPSCGDGMPPEARKSGPDAPSIGWEYWECPSCGDKHAPKTVNDAQ